MISEIKINQSINYTRWAGVCWSIATFDLQGEIRRKKKMNPWWLTWKEYTCSSMSRNDIVFFGLWADLRMSVMIQYDYFCQNLHVYMLYSSSRRHALKRSWTDIHGWVLVSYSEVRGGSPDHVLFPPRSKSDPARTAALSPEAPSRCQSQERVRQKWKKNRHRNSLAAYLIMIQ